MLEYNSSQELRRHNAAVFAEAEDKKRVATQTEREKCIKFIDTYIVKHSSTTHVRDLANGNKNVEKYGVEYQLDLSADLVEILEKIKKGLG